MIRAFYLYRLVDETGISGSGFVAEGTQFSDGTCVLRWLSNHKSTAIYGDIKTVRAIHGHAGKTCVFWEDADFVHVPTGQPVYFTGAQITRPTVDGDVLFDGWPNERDYVRIGRWLDEQRGAKS